ncbi:unnamed protein product [Didymodactylos carnosus]|uniref:Mab-21-like HhH/H2TH-like domain-containing protein n=1 Tax=Didymodactylos carnosus TaxID=1234261 RepID=A0A814FTS1_9BILA|nr:unnamed protein product [Didymodactylos carnosus]CAF1021530.1 unnamed protein product [Didymodactylos carnosus]CAF3757033.1 unnamed protein product [Didymodactylos carnosus]CAF3790170.1 unnamed protein product [Didymodactylos carnosus]
MSAIINDQNFHHDIYSILSPAFGYRFSENHLQKILAVLEFYCRYRNHLIEFDLIRKGITEQDLTDLWTPDFDFVLSFKLEFWPEDLHWFLKRFEEHRPLLYEKIKTIYMHVVPKWSGKSSIENKNIEFRYSFSLIEMKLAAERSEIEQILNRVARGLFYKYLHKSADVKSDNEKYLTSYFVKTTVLWMCEIINFDSIYTYTLTTEEKLAERVAKRWIDFACSKLEEGNCPHYFIKDLNLLEGLSSSYLKQLCTVLKTKINFKDNQMTELSHVELDENQLNSLSPSQMETFAELFTLPQLSNDCKELSNKVMGSHSSTRNESLLLDSDTQGLLCLFMLAMYDSFELDNWTRWKRLFVDSVAAESKPVLYPRADDETLSQITISPLYVVATMVSACSVKEIDQRISVSNFNEQLQAAYSRPFYSMGNMIPQIMTRNMQMLQQLDDESTNRTVAKDIMPMVNELVNEYQATAPNFFNQLFYSDQHLTQEGGTTTAIPELVQSEYDEDSILSQVCIIS